MQSSRITAVPVTEEFQHQVLQDLPRVGTAMAKIIRGNNFNRPVYKGDVRPNLIREIYQYLSSVGNLDGYRKVTDADITDYSNRQSQADDINLEEPHTHDESQCVVLPDGVYSPGQDNMPIWFLQMSSPYAKTMPIFFPKQTGDWDDPRRDPTRPISESEWIGHILRSVYKHLAEFPLFPFTAAYRLDMKAIQSAYNSCTGYRQLPDGSFERREVDGHRLVGTVVGSSEWYTKQKLDICAKCENVYNPSLFVTLTSSDNWDVNLSTALSQDGWNVWHKNDEQRMLNPLEGQIHPDENEGNYFVHSTPSRLLEDDCPYHLDCKRSPIKGFLAADTEKQLLSRNTYSLQRIFCQRTGSLLRNVVMSTSNGIEGVAFHFLKEFGYEGGLAHSHGLVWQKESLAQSTLLKMQNGEPVSTAEEEHICDLADRTVTASLHAGNLKSIFSDLNEERSEDIVELAKQVQIHTCVTKCSIDNVTDGCLYHFPRLPTETTLVCSPIGNSMEKEAAWYLESQCRKVKINVRSVIKKLNANGDIHHTSLVEVLLEALGPVDSQEPDDGRYHFKNFGLFLPCERLAKWIEIMQNMGHVYPIMFSLYYTALSTSTWHVQGELVYQLVLKRSVGESYAVDYNPYFLESMRSNMEVRYVTHTPHLLINYISKAEEKPNIKKVIEDIKRTGGTVSGAAVATRAQDYRKVSLPEAFFRIDTRLNFSNTNLQVLFVNTNFPDERGRKYEPSHEGDIQLPGRDGLFKLVEGTLAKYGKR